MSQELAEYVREALTEYILEKYLKDEVLEDNPVPNNVTKANKLDSFFKGLFRRGQEEIFCQKR